MKTVSVELVVRMQVPDDLDLVNTAVDLRNIQVPLRVGHAVIQGTEVVGYPTEPVETSQLTVQWRITDGNFALHPQPQPMFEAIKEAHREHPE